MFLDLRITIDAIEQGFINGELHRDFHVDKLCGQKRVRRANPVANERQGRFGSIRAVEVLSRRQADPS